MPIEDEERARRAQIVEATRERAKKQGMSLTKEMEELAELYVQGHLTIEQFAGAGLNLYLPQLSALMGRPER